MIYEVIGPRTNVRRGVGIRIENIHRGTRAPASWLESRHRCLPDTGEASDVLIMSSNSACDGSPKPQTELVQSLLLLETYVCRAPNPRIADGLPLRQQIHGPMWHSDSSGHKWHVSTCCDSEVRPIISVCVRICPLTTGAVLSADGVLLCSNAGNNFETSPARPSRGAYFFLAQYRMKLAGQCAWPRASKNV